MTTCVGKSLATPWVAPPVGFVASNTRARSDPGYFSVPLRDVSRRWAEASARQRGCRSRGRQQLLSVHVPSPCDGDGSAWRWHRVAPPRHRKDDNALPRLIVW